jgi:hypothetical protein
LFAHVVTATGNAAQLCGFDLEINGRIICSAKCQYWGCDSFFLGNAMWRILLICKHCYIIY